MAKWYTRAWLETTRLLKCPATHNHIPVVGATIKRPNPLNPSQWFIEYVTRSVGVTVAVLSAEEAADDAFVMGKIEAWLAEMAA